MSTITDIRPQKNGKRVNIYLDGKFGFGLDLENYLKYQLKVGQELAEEKIAEIVKKGEFNRTLDKILRFATFRPRSEKEIRDWLKRKKVHESLHEELFNRLKHLELLDDKRFAAWWIEQRVNFRPKGKKALEFELRQKGLNNNIIQEVLSEIEIDETKVAKDLLKRNSYKWERLDKLTAKRKKTEFLARKGLSWSLISQILGDQED